MKRRKWLFLVILIFSVELVSAQQKVAPPPSTKQTKPATQREVPEKSVFARLMFGGARMNSQWGEYWTFNEPALNFGFLMAAAIVPRFYLHWVIDGTVIPNPSYSGLSATPENISMVNVGAGFTYYIAPQSTYIESSVNISKAILTVEDGDIETDEDGVSPSFTIALGFDKIFNNTAGIGTKLFYQWGNYSAQVFEYNQYQYLDIDVFNGVFGASIVLSIGRF